MSKLALLLFILTTSNQINATTQFPATIISPQVLFSDFQNEISNYMVQVAPTCRIFQYPVNRQTWNCAYNVTLDWRISTSINTQSDAGHLNRLTVTTRSQQTASHFNLTTDRPLTQDEQYALFNLEFPLTDFNRATLTFSGLPILVSWHQNAAGFDFRLQSNTGRFEQFQYLEYQENGFIFRRILFSQNHRSELNMLVKLLPDETLQYFINGDEIPPGHFFSTIQSIRTGMAEFAHGLLIHLIYGAHWPQIYFGH